MAKFFVNRPVVAMVIAILTVMVGTAALVRLPIAQFPNIAPPQVQLWATYVGADAMTRVPGIGQVNVFGAGQYAMRFWVRPDTLARLNITVNEIIEALVKQNTVNPAGQIGAEPVPPGQVFTYTVRTRGRLTSVEEFE